MTGGSAPPSSRSAAVWTLISLTAAALATVEPGPIGVNADIKQPVHA